MYEITCWGNSLDIYLTIRKVHVMYTRVLSCFHDPTSGSRLLLHLTQSTGSKNVAEIYVHVSQIYKNISIFIEIADKMFSLFLNLRLSLWDIYNGNTFAGY